MKQIKSKKLIILILIFTLFSGLFLVNINNAKAFNPLEWGTFGLFYKVGKLFGDTTAGKVLAKSAQEMLGGLTYLFWSAAKWWVGICASLFTSVLDFTTETLSGKNAMNSVYDGWKISRDIVNMFFILGLVVIAFATILKIETYGMKTLLPKIIIMALLINFSYLACGIIIDTTHIITNFFIAPMEKDAGDIGIGGRLQVAMLEMKQENLPKGEELMPSGETNIIIAELYQCAAMFGVSFILLLGAVLLVIRMAGLYVLIILAPFAWFFSIFPTLKAMSSKWWNNFLKYAFFAPIYVFFIYLGLQIVTNLGIKTLTIEAPESFKYSMVYLTNYLFALIIFAGAPIVAMSMGIYSSSAIIKTAKGALGKAARAPIRGAWRKFDRQVLAPRGLSPKAIKTAWEMRREEKEEKAFRPAIGGWRDMFNKYLPFSKREKTFYGEQESDLLIDKERTKLVKQSLSKDGLADIANASKKSGDMPRFQAALLELVSRGDEEGLFQHKELGAEYGYITSTENMAQLIQDSIKDKEEAIRFAGKVGASAKLSGIPQYDGMTEYNLKKKEMAWTPVSQMGAQGGYEAMKVYAQRRWRTFNRRAYLSMDKDGKPVEVTNAFKVMLRTIDTSDIDRATKEMSGLNKRYVAIDGKDKVQAEINRITDTTQKKIAQDWLNGIEESLTAEKTSTSKPPTSPTSEPRISTGTSEEEFKKAREKHKPGEFG